MLPFLGLRDSLSLHFYGVHPTKSCVFEGRSFVYASVISSLPLYKFCGSRSFIPSGTWQCHRTVHWFSVSADVMFVAYDTVVQESGYNDYLCLTVWFLKHLVLSSCTRTSKCFRIRVILLSYLKAISNINSGAGKESVGVCSYTAKFQLCVGDMIFHDSRWDQLFPLLKSLQTFKFHIQTF